MLQKTLGINLKWGKNGVTAGLGHGVWFPSEVGKCGIDKTVGITDGLEAREEKDKFG